MGKTGRCAALIRGLQVKEHCFLFSDLSALLLQCYFLNSPALQWERPVTRHWKHVGEHWCSNQ
eukprot:1147101-Pelagomonas_calceolata.AAC.1